MKHRVLVLIALLALCAGATTSLSAQVRFGPQVSFADDADFGIGARLEYGLDKLFPKAPLLSAASFDYFFPGNNVTYWEINYNVSYLFKVDALTPYAGGGLHFAHASVDGGGSNSEMGLNLLGGLRFKTASKLTPFVEARIELGGGEQFVLTGGLVF